MVLTQIAGEDCRKGDCPAIFTTDCGTLAIQGYAIDKRTPEGEEVVEIPMNLLREAVSALGW